MKKFLLKLAGIAFLLLGIAGLFLPILQGWLFIFIGLSLLSPRLAARIRSAVFLRFCKKPLITLSEWNRFGASAGVTTRLFPAHLASTDDLNEAAHRSAVRSLWADPKKPRPERFAYLRQVHGKRVVPVASGDFKEGDFLRVLDADALVTADPKTALLVLSADCLPVFFAATRGDQTVAVALAHAGWKGTREKIAVETLNELRRISGVSDEDIYAALGPSMDGAHYEVGPEFRNYFPAGSLKEKKGKLYFNLCAENERQLVEAGLKRSRVIDTCLSTVRHNRLFHSFRLEKDRAGRTVSYIYIPSV